MIALKSTSELKVGFDKLISTISVPVEWSGVFVIQNNFMILKGSERSAIFNFDTRKFGTNIVDLNIKEQDIKEIGNNMLLVNIFNMILYAFGKWGALKRVKVDKSYEQLNGIFKGIMSELRIEPDYNEEHYYFYKDGMRISYEEVVLAAFAIRQEEEKENAAMRAAGLWHNMTWEAGEYAFRLKKLTDTEKKTGRLGNNFYITGYLCPQCGKGMYMSVFPKKREPVIDTSEGRVRLARVFTCPGCCIFYTPLPDRLIAEGLAYALDFEGDEAAYEDYQGLIGKNGGQTGNGGFNEYIDGRGKKEGGEGGRKRPDLNSIAKDPIPERRDLNGIEKFDVLDFVEEGFYEGEEVARAEETIRECWQRRERGVEKTEETEETRQTENVGEPTHSTMGGGTEARENKAKNGAGGQNAQQTEKVNRAGEEASQTKEADSAGKPIIRTEAGEEANQVDAGDVPTLQRADESEAEAISQYEKRIEQYERLSERQIGELSKQLEQDKRLVEPRKKELKEKLHIKEQEKNLKVFIQKTENIGGKNYAVLERLYEEVHSADIPEDAKRELLEQVRAAKKEQGGREVAKLVAGMPQNLDRKGYESWLKKIRAYKDADITEYEEQFKAKKQQAEKKEAENMVKQARKNTRTDLTDLKKRIKEQEFSPEITREYLERVDEAIEKMDRRRLDSACADYMNMAGDELDKLYTDIEDGDFLPELKKDVLGKIGRRLQKIKTDECELLINKFKKILSEENVPDNERHYFYPARKVLANEAKDEEISLINYAMGTYATGAGPFEYPVMVVDTTRGNTGKEGMIITSEHIFYSTLLTCSSIEVGKVKSVEASTGLIGKGIILHLEDGVKCKLPYAVDTKEMKNYAKALENFISYLKERPFSRKEKYLVKEKHQTICCFRCGYVYKDAKECPKCGYKLNN